MNRAVLDGPYRNRKARTGFLTTLFLAFAIGYTLGLITGLGFR